VEDNLEAHAVRKPHAVRGIHGIQRMEWPPSSPDFNSIENLCDICQNQVWKKMDDPSNRVRTQEEYLALCHMEWGGMDWAGVDGMIDRADAGANSGIFEGKGRPYKVFVDSLFCTLSSGRAFFFLFFVFIWLLRIDELLPLDRRVPRWCPTTSDK
jgi:hypothetical protein